MVKVFLSHSSEDKGFVGWLEKKLYANGIKTFLNPITPGGYIAEDLAAKVKESDYLFFINSNASINSLWAKDELFNALNLQMQGKLKKVIPIKYYPCQTITALGSRLCLNFYEDYDSFDINFNKLINALV